MKFISKDVKTNFIISQNMTLMKVEILGGIGDLSLYRQSFDNPAARTRQCSVRSGNILIVFGGIDHKSSRIL